MEKMETVLRRVASDLPENPSEAISRFFGGPTESGDIRVRSLEVTTFSISCVTYGESSARNGPKVFPEQGLQGVDKVFSIYLTDLANSVRRATT